MRGVMIIGLVAVSLIIGLLVIKNMGVDNSGGVTETQAQKYIEKAENAADNAQERIKNISDRVNGSE
ncbi:MAG: hypothetical protein KJO34_01225 [Deltaproteobacteria bacterium]|nr:hypothetical protein [Deltaproteobacteria bacterium]